MIQRFPETVQSFSSNSKIRNSSKIWFSNSQKFPSIRRYSSKIWKFKLIRAKFQIIQVQFQKFLRNSNYFRLFHMIRSVFRKVPTSSTCIRKNSATSGWLPVNVISVQASSGQCRISLFVFWSVLPLRAPKMLYV